MPSFIRLSEQSYQVLENLVMKLGKRGRTKILDVGDTATNRAGLTIVRGRGYLSCADKEGKSFDFRNMRVYATSWSLAQTIHGQMKRARMTTTLRERS